MVGTNKNKVFQLKKLSVIDVIIVVVIVRDPSRSWPLLVFHAGTEGPRPVRRSVVAWAPLSESRVHARGPCPAMRELIWSFRVTDYTPPSRGSWLRGEPFSEAGKIPNHDHFGRVNVVQSR